MFDMDKIKSVFIIDPSTTGQHKGMFRFVVKSSSSEYLNSITGPFEPMSSIYVIAEWDDGEQVSFFHRIFTTGDPETIAIVKMMQ